MNEIREILKRYDLKPKKYTKKGKVTIVDTDQGKMVFKKRTGNDLGSIYRYLNARNFNYYPKIYNQDTDDSYYMSEYIEESDMPKEQKAIDLIKLIALLHNKTTFYKEVDMDYYKEIYETTNDRITYLSNYYNDINTIIDSKVYMSPSEYLLARNISKIYANLRYCKDNLEKWYKMIKDSKKQRYVTVHNNLDLDSFMKTEESYLISLEHAEISLPIYDFLTLYKRHYQELDFVDLYHIYTTNYPLRKEEQILLFLLLSIPDKIEVDQDEYQMCKQLNNLFEYIYETENLIVNTSQEKQEAHQ